MPETTIHKREDIYEHARKAVNNALPEVAPELVGEVIASIGYQCFHYLATAQSEQVVQSLHMLIKEIEEKYKLPID